MECLNLRTGARPNEVGRAQRTKFRKAKALPEYVPPNYGPKHKGPKVYLSFRNMHLAKYYYNKGQRGKCKIGAERSAHGIRWNYYLRTRKNIVRIAPKVFSGSIPICSGILKDISAGKEKRLKASGFVRQERKKEHTSRMEEKKPLLRTKHKGCESAHSEKRTERVMSRRETADRRRDSGDFKHVTRNLAKVIPIKVHQTSRKEPERTKASDKHRINVRVDKRAERVGPQRTEAAKAKPRHQPREATKIDAKAPKPTVRHPSRKDKPAAFWRCGKQDTREKTKPSANLKRDTATKPRGINVKKAGQSVKGKGLREVERKPVKIMITSARSQTSKAKKGEDNLFYICGQKKRMASPLRVAQADAQPPQR